MIQFYITYAEIYCTKFPIKKLSQFLTRHVNYLTFMGFSFLRPR